jgi:hypothetical protein
MQNSRRALSALLASAVLLAGCGGGGGASQNPAAAPAPSPAPSSVATSFSIHGVAATGAPMAGTYSSLARLNLIQLAGSDINDMQWSSSTALFKVQAP